MENDVAVGPNCPLEGLTWSHDADVSTVKEAEKSAVNWQTTGAGEACPAV